jgi:tRNA (cytidine/uridine-2'-O-)-methyltransferase
LGEGAPSPCPSHKVERRFLGEEFFKLTALGFKPVSTGVIDLLKYSDNLFFLASMKDNQYKDHLHIKDPFLNIVLYQPEIPANTGNIARLCGAAMIRLHLIHPLGFSVDDKHLRRAGIDYWHEVDVTHHKNFEAFLLSDAGIKDHLYCYSKSAERLYTEAAISKGSYLLFGPESVGLPEKLKNEYPCFRIPIFGNVRSLNLSTSVGIVSYHYLYEMMCFVEGYQP